MSYDLYFRPQPETSLSQASFLAYFDGRANYEVSEGGAWYENKDTGIYFSFDYGQDEPSFNLNYFRPHTFGLEAELEVSHFVRHFGLLVDDPQMNGMGEGVYSTEGFLRGWNGGNAFACQAFQATGVADASTLYLPGPLLERVWRWNYQRDSLQEELGEEIFVPLILFLLYETRLHLAVAWSNGIPVALPEVDSLIVMAPSAPGGFGLMPFDHVRPLLADFSRVEGETSYWLLDYEEPPSALMEMLFNPPAATGRLTIVSADQVLDRELLEQQTSAP